MFLSGTLKHNRLYPSTNRRNPYDGSGVSFENAGVLLCDHTGTHMDAPLHADPNGSSIDQLPLEYGLGSAVWLDVSFRFGDGNEITAKDLVDAERSADTKVQRGDIVLIWTGWSTVLPDTDRYLYKHMGLTRDAAEWLRERGARTVGVDLSTPETLRGAESGAVHMNFLKPTSLGLSAKDVILIVENLVNIRMIPKHRFYFQGVPLPLQGLTGSPVRALAILQD